MGRSPSSTSTKGSGWLWSLDGLGLPQSTPEGGRTRTCNLRQSRPEDSTGAATGGDKNEADSPKQGALVPSGALFNGLPTAPLSIGSRALRSPPAHLERTYKVGRVFVWCPLTSNHCTHAAWLLFPSRLPFTQQSFEHLLCAQCCAKHRAQTRLSQHLVPLAAH